MMPRASGILLHITSLPSPFGIGDLGPWAYRFVDFLAESGQRFWQILPLNPTESVFGNSPYHSTSAFAGNPLLISPDGLVEEGLLERGDVETLPDFPAHIVDFDKVISYKQALLHRAYERFKGGREYEYERFCSENRYWLPDCALFRALRARNQGKVWSEWPPDLRDRVPRALESAGSDFIEAVKEEKFLQYIFHKQWSALRGYCHQKEVRIMGDLPIYVQYDSADVWAHPDLFKLDEEKKPSAVAGVPPDYFSKTGQLWGNPVYRWDVLKERGYDWWIERIRYNITLLDYLRLDHFRGFVGFWELPAEEKTAINGRWIKAPAEDFFESILRSIPSPPLIAEDLGVITPDVVEIMDRFGFPGMKLLLFAFGDAGGANPYLPHNLVANCVAYTGTHDNNTVRGWFKNDATAPEKAALLRYLGRNVPVKNLHWELIRLLMMSVANLTIFPMQDILGLGGEARMNRPSTANGNWEWRLAPDALTTDLRARLRSITEIYGRR
ncbi:MAG: 4-alpha-glucanotransferase [Deltaproteobacteria bacterium]|nr:4-alpha-glucanotransferase [Deltaproteobacteria bacterium]